MTRRPAGMRRKTVAPALLLMLALVPVAVGCSPPSATGTPEAEETLVSDDSDVSMTQSVGSTCGQFSALVGVGTHADSALDGGEITQDEYDAVMSLLSVSWQNTLPAPELRSALAQLDQLASGDSPFSTNSPEYYAALESVLKRCAKEGEGLVGSGSDGG